MKTTFCITNGFFYQYLGAISGSLAIVSAGIHLGWTSPYLPKIIAGNEVIKANSEEGSWIAVMPLIGGSAGGILAVALVDRIGRKKTILVMAPIMLGVYTTIAFSTSIYSLCVARFFSGSVEGGLYTVLPMYIGEIAEPRVRGQLSSIITFSAKIGTLFINVIGPYTSIFTSSLICLLVPITHFVIFLWMPESPYFWAKKNSQKNTKRCLKQLRGGGDEETELMEIYTAVQKQEGTKKAKVTDLFLVPSNRRAAIIFTVASLGCHFSGKVPFQFYTSSIFAASKTGIGPNMATILYCTIEILATLVSLVLIDRFGRRPLILGSAFGCSLMLALEGCYFYLLAYYEELTVGFEWVPVLVLISYNVIFNFGLAFGHVVLLSELFPTSIKAVALCCGETSAALTAAIASKVFQVTTDQIGIFVPFWIFSCCCVILGVLMIKIVPETKGKSLEDIQQYLRGERMNL